MIHYIPRRIPAPWVVQKVGTDIQARDASEVGREDYINAGDFAAVDVDA